MEDREELMQTWVGLVAGLDAGLRLKLNHWTKIPHLLCGLAHTDPQVVSTIATLCLKQWSSAEEEGQHRLAVLYLSATQPSFRPYVEQLAAGTELKDLPTSFQLAVLRFRFVPIPERRIEEKHARLARRAVARQYGGAYASNLLRLPVLERRLETHPAMITELMGGFTTVRSSPGEMLRCLGMENHESVRLVMSIPERTQGPCRCPYLNSNQLVCSNLDMFYISHCCMLASGRVGSKF